MPLVGFRDSKTRTKHFKKHVLGKGGGTAWSADMPGWYANASDYEQAALAFANAQGSFHAETFPIVTLETARGHTARWNQNTGLFVCYDSCHIITYHIRADASLFQRAILEF